MGCAQRSCRYGGQGPGSHQDPSCPTLARVETLRAWSLCPQAEVGFVGNGQGHCGEVTLDIWIPRARLLVDGGAALCRGPCGRFLQPQEHGAWRSQDCPVQSERGQPRPDLQVQLIGPWSREVPSVSIQGVGGQVRSRAGHQGSFHSWGSHTDGGGQSRGQLEVLITDEWARGRCGGSPGRWGGGMWLKAQPGADGPSNKQ